MRFGALVAGCMLAWSPQALAQAVPEGSDAPPVYEDWQTRPFRAPDNPGGERQGQDDRPDNFDGYPVHPGTPDDAYYDASAEHRVYAPNYNGSFVSPGVWAGVGLATTPYFDEVAPGPVVGVQAQFSSIQQIVDLSAQYFFGTYRPIIDGQDFTLQRHTLSASVALHPFFLRILRSGRSGFTESNAAFLGGPNIEWTTLEGPALQYQKTGLGWHLGAIAGTYLDDPHDSCSFWLEGAYRYNNTTRDRQHPLGPQDRIQEHWIMLRLSWRYNGNLVAGLPRPVGP